MNDMKLLKAALCALALVATTSLMAQVTQTEQRRIGNWVVIEEYEIIDEDEVVTRERKLKVKGGKEYTTSRRMEAHYPSFYMGFSRLSNSPQSIDYAAGINQNQDKSWEWGVYLNEKTIPFNKRGTFGISYAFGFGRTQYRFNNGNYFFNNHGITCYGVNSTKDYDETWFRYWGFRLPVNIELQRYVNGEPFFLTFGPEFEYRFSPKSLGRCDGGKQRAITKNLDLNPFNVNLMAQVGYDNIGFMAKLSLIELFQNPLRPEPLIGGVGMSTLNCEVYPLTLGFSIFY